MRHEEINSQVIELTNEIPPGVRFDPDQVMLQGNYGDQLSAYRARKGWVEALERCFLLEDGHDYNMAIRSDLPKASFLLRCTFETACARYAFWRLTNDQAPEAQYLIETAHIPDCDSHQHDMMGAPDLKSSAEDPLVMSGRGQISFNEERAPLGWIQKLIKKLS